MSENESKSRPRSKPMSLTWRSGGAITFLAVLMVVLLILLSVFTAAIPDSAEVLVPAFTALMSIFGVTIAALVHGIETRATERTRRLADQIDHVGGLHQELRRLLDRFGHIKKLMENSGEMKLTMEQRIAGLRTYDCSVSAWQRHGSAIGSTAVYDQISDAYSRTFEINHMIEVALIEHPIDPFYEESAQLLAENIGERIPKISTAVGEIGDWLEIERQKL